MAEESEETEMKGRNVRWISSSCVLEDKVEIKCDCGGSSKTCARGGGTDEIVIGYSNMRIR